MNTPLVLDSGSHSLKAALAGSSSPLQVPCLVGRPKYKAVMQVAQQQEVVSGQRLQEMAGILRLSSPMQEGSISNYQDMTKVWQGLFAQLGLGQEHPVLFSQPPLCTQQQSLKVAEIFLEEFRVPAFQTVTSGYLSLMSEGKTDGLVLTSGHGLSFAESFEMGRALTHATTQDTLAGAEVTAQLGLLLSQRGHLFQSSAEQQIVGKVKEKCCGVLPQTGQNVLQTALASSRTDGSDLFLLPDGNSLSLEEEKFTAAEVLFQPELVGRESLGLPELLLTCLDRSDMDYRKMLLNNLVLSGGTTLLQGFPQRLVQELKQKLPQHNQVRIMASQGRELSAWRGGSVLASLVSFSDSWITQADWAEEGAQALQRRSLF